MMREPIPLVLVLNFCGLSKSHMEEDSVMGLEWKNVIGTKCHGNEELGKTEKLDLNTILLPTEKPT